VTIGKPVPDWLIVGAPKAGTTTLAAWLGEHPDAFVSPVKEVSYFDLHYDRGPAWYAAHFDGAAPGQLVGESTPAYMYVDAALDRLAADAPDVRLAIILREPVDRVWSNYWYFRAMGIDGRPFSRILRSERRDPTSAPRGMPIGHLAASRYIDRIEAITKRFSRDQLQVLFFDDLRKDPAALFSSLCRHFGLDDTVSPPSGGRAHNVGRMPRWYWLQWASLRFGLHRLPMDLGPKMRRWNVRSGSYPKISPALDAELRELFAPANRRLESWLGRPLPASWSGGSAHA
jgi:hypothetical protein